MNLRELFSKYPLDCESFNAEWLLRWEAVGRLLARPARYEYAAYMPKHIWCNRLEASVALCISRAKREHGFRERRVILLDGTVVKEWGAT